MYGSRSPKKASASPNSDVEFIAILDDPDDPEDFKYYKQINIEFLYHDIPADIWSTSWHWLEKLADRTDSSVCAATS